jgi:hypothetical protein
VAAAWEALLADERAHTSHSPGWVRYEALLRCGLEYRRQKRLWTAIQRGARKSGQTKFRAIASEHVACRLLLGRNGDSLRQALVATRITTQPCAANTQSKPFPHHHCEHVSAIDKMNHEAAAAHDAMPNEQHGLRRLAMSGCSALPSTHIVQTASDHLDSRKTGRVTS